VFFDHLATYRADAIGVSTVWRVFKPPGFRMLYEIVFVIPRELLDGNAAVFRRITYTRKTERLFETVITDNCTCTIR
jgi:hypothetical protein